MKRIQPNQKQDNAFAIAAALEKLRKEGCEPYRVARSMSETHTWAYYAVETESWWLVTSEELATLADLDYTTWAESSASTAVEYGRRRPVTAE